MADFAKIAFLEYGSPETSVKHGGVGGSAFWNINSSQFMFAPAFQFPEIPWGVCYTFTAKDSLGNSYSFEADSPKEPLYPIWSKLSPGFVELVVVAKHKDGQEYNIGSRTFYKMEPFPGRDALPPRARSYKDSALLGLNYVLRDKTTRSFLEKGVPDEKYFHNAYPSKMISSIISGMVEYSLIDESVKEEAISLARAAADYLLSITYKKPYALYGVPPTYSLDNLDVESVRVHASAAIHEKGKVMAIYPASVGLAYIELWEATGEQKYFSAAMDIGDYYKRSVLDNGSFYLMVYAESGKEVTKNPCISFKIIDFFAELYKHTNNGEYLKLKEDYYNFLITRILKNYAFDGQFEDTAVTSQYKNLTHVSADQMICYFAKNCSQDEELMDEAEKLMRYVEDQFVTWGKFAPWSKYYRQGEWSSPAALEQYNWHVPIDGSASMVIRAFLSLYSCTKKELYLEKAKALGDSITRMQHETIGVIPTHWMDKRCTELVAESPCNDNFWINCHIGTALTMLELAKAAGEM